MDNLPEKKGRELTKEEEQEYREGMALYEMTKTVGWEVLRKMLEDRAYHSWVDPKETNVKEEWVWRELNLFHSSDVAKQLIIDIEKAISRADYLDKVKKVEITVRSLKI